MDSGMSLALLLNVIVVVVVVRASSPEEEMLRLKDLSLDFAVQYFNEHTKRQQAFKLYSVEKSITSESDRATTFQLEFTVKQTNCLKANFDKEKCEYQKGPGNMRQCFACFKFWKGNSQLPNYFVDCIPAKLLNTMRDGDRKAKCAEVTQAEDSHLPGMYSFSVGKPS